jgi:Uncharacterized protein conserved in bacteria (DUF2188)
MARARPVKITTPIPTLDELAARLGLSKARQRALDPIFIERRPQGGYAVRRRGAKRPSLVAPTQREAVELARELSPIATILVERVRATANGNQAKWRKP